MKNLIVMVGIPCSGKSTIVSEINKNLGYDVLSYDNIREEYCKRNGIYYEDSFNIERICKIITKLYHLEREELVSRGADIILDNTNIDSKARWSLDVLFPDYKKKAIFFDTPLEVCLERNKLRKWKYIPEDIIKNFNVRKEEPSYHEGYVEILKV